jgi:hypothetical protein
LNLKGNDRERGDMALEVSQLERLRMDLERRLGQERARIAQLILLNRGGVFGLAEALMACFVQAVQVGIEMERAELSAETVQPKGDPHQ